MSHPVLVGEYDLTIDDKNRLLVPADIRRSIPAEQGEGFYLTIGVNGVPWFWPERYYEGMVMQVPGELTPTEEDLEFDQLVFALASRIAWDKQGRILIPEKTLKRASITKDVTLISSRDHLELWNRVDWEARRASLESRRAEIEARRRAARQARTGPIAFPPMGLPPQIAAAPPASPPTES